MKKAQVGKKSIPQTSHEASGGSTQYLWVIAWSIARRQLLLKPISWKEPISEAIRRVIIAHAMIQVIFIFYYRYWGIQTPIQRRNSYLLNADT